MPSIFDLLYREYCRARLAEMRKQLLISPEHHEAPAAICDAKDTVGASPAGGGETATQQELPAHSHGGELLNWCCLEFTHRHRRARRAGAFLGA